MQKTEVEKAVAAEQEHQEKLGLKALVIFKSLTRKDRLDAIEALDEAWSDLTEQDLYLVAAKKAKPALTWDDLINMPMSDVELVILGK